MESPLICIAKASVAERLAAHRPCNEFRETSIPGVPELTGKVAGGSAGGIVAGAADVGAFGATGSEPGPELGDVATSPCGANADLNACVSDATVTGGDAPP